MKIIKYIAILLIIVLVATYALLFTAPGNNLLKPYISKTSKEKTGYDIDIKNFDLNFGSIDISADVNNEISTNIKGDYSLFSRNFDLDYDIYIADLKSFGVNLTEPMGLKGKIRGKIKEFSVNGVGKMLDSDIRFLATMLDMKPFNLDLDAKGLNASKALALAGQPIYLSGNINAVANIKNGVGEANITSNNLALNKDSLKEQNITIPNDIAIDINSNITYKDNTMLAKSVINSALANLSAEKTSYSFESKILESDFKVLISNLGNLEPFTKQKLNGSVNLDGVLKLNDNNLEFIDLNLDGFGGRVIAKLANNILNANIENIQTSELMGVIAMPKAVNGVINGTASIQNLQDTAKIKGSANLKLTQGKIIPNELKKLVNIDFPADNSFNINSDTVIEKGLVATNSNLNSNLLNIPNLKATYDLKNKDLKANFSAIIDDLKNLQVFTKKALHGSLKANGDISTKNSKLSALNLSIDTLGGNIKANSNGSNLDATVSKLDISDLFALIGQTHLASGNLEASINLTTIDPKNLNGKVNLSVNNGILNHTELSKLLNKEFPSKVKFSSKNSVNINSSVANFDSLINSDLANIDSLKGNFNINTKALDAKYNINIPDLRKLKFLAGRNLNGAINANGDIKKDGENLVATANSNLFNGTLNANINNEKINAKFTKFQILELTNMLDLGKFYEGIGDLTLDYNTKNQNGNFHVDINQGRLTKSALTDAVSLITQRDITKQIFNDSYIKGVIKSGLVNFNSVMKAPKMDLNITSGTLDTKTSKINIPVEMNIEKTDISATIKGTTQNPKVNVSSNYIEKKIDKVIDKIFGSESKETSTKTDTSAKPDKLKSDDKLKDTAKELFKGLFDR
ncbi:MAG: hypothetical protein GXZ15_04025 [Campylobacter sp.]|nr:hypothetical protein [Campylobacter sp.]